MLRSLKTLETKEIGKKLFERLKSDIRADELFESLLNYFEVSLELLKMDAHEGISRILSKIAEFVVVVILVTLLIIFGSIAAALFLNYFLDSAHYVGFTIVALFYFAILLFYYLIVKRKTDEKIEENVGDALEKIKIPKPDNHGEENQ
jgi:hypothetical protein